MKIGTHIPAAFLGFACLLAGCAAAPTSQQVQARKDAYAWQRASAVPFEQRPALFAKMEQDGEITPAKRQEWDRWWVANKEQAKEEERQKKEHERMLASLTPAQRLNLELRERELQMRQEQFDRQMDMQAQQAEVARRQANAQAIAAAANSAMAGGQQAADNYNRSLTDARANLLPMQTPPPQHHY